MLVPDLAAARKAAPRVTFSGFGKVRLGDRLDVAATRLRRPVVSTCGGRQIRVGAILLDDLASLDGRVSDIHTARRGVTGPRGVRVGMTQRQVRNALGRRSVAFTVKRRAARLLVGPRGRTLWVLAAARGGRVAHFGVASSKRLARVAAGQPCSSPPRTAPPPPETQPPASSGQEPGPSPDPAPTPAVCPATLPKVGPYMTVTCGPDTQNQVVFTCYSDWLDPNHDPVDGCEAEKHGLQQMLFSELSNRALADHILGTYDMAGYYETPPPSYTPDVYQGPNPMLIEVPSNCSGSPTVACPNGQPSNPPATIEADFTEHAGDTPRIVLTIADPHPDPTQNTMDDLTVRVRLKTPAPIPITVPLVGDCGMNIDSGAGTYPDVRFDTRLTRLSNRLTGPPSQGTITLTQLETADVSLTGSFGCQFASLGLSFFIGTLTDTLGSWFTPAAALCGAASPYYWQPCPP